MEANNNKENVVLPLSKKHNNPVLSTAQSSKKIVKKRRFERIPLSDITHLFNHPPQSCSLFPNLPLSLVSVVSDSRTRKALLLGVSDPANVPASKSLRMGFR